MHGKVMDIKGNDDSPGTEVILWEKDDGGPDNQLWYISRDGIIRSKLNGFTLDSSGKLLLNGPYEILLSSDTRMQIKVVTKC